MSFFGILIFIIIVSAIWKWIKEQFSGGENHYSNGRNRFSVNCPYCNRSLLIDGPGNWNCEYCQNTFHYDRSQGSMRFEDFLTPQIEALVRLFAKVAKADGVVTHEEVHRVDAIIKDEFQPNSIILSKIRNVFNDAKATPEGFQAEINKLYQYFREDSVVLNGILTYLTDIAMMDGGIHPEQKRIIDYTQDRFRINFDGGTGQNTQNKYSHESALDQYYKTLGCSPTDSLETIKKNYRQLIKEYHPDKYMNQNLPKDFIDLANKRVQEIQEAYEAIMKQKASA